jgi:MFS family permease
MNERTKTGLEILEAAVLLGVLGDVMLRQTPWGLNILLFIGALVAAFMMMVLRRKREFWNAPTIALNLALVFFAAMFVWRDSMELRTFDTLAILTILAILTLPALKIKTQVAGVFHYLIGFIWSGISAGFAPFFLFFNDVEWKTIPQTGWSKHLIAVLRGILIAAPILLVFGALFVAADAVFQNIVERTLNIQPDIVVSHIFFIGFFSWIIAGYLRGSLIQNFSNDVAETFLEPKDEIKPQVPSVTEIKDEDPPKAEEQPKKEEKKSWSWQNLDNSALPKVFTLGAIEVSIVLGLINLLFLSFVIVQLPYLFGGFELVQNTPDFKLAEYARRGFGELVAVAALVLPILLVSHWLLRKDSPVNEKIYRVLAGIQIALLFVIMISAAQRLFILTGNLGYGLTTMRFYPMIMMIWLAVVFLWFAATVLRGARERFAWGALWSAIIILGGLHFVNPDAYIARTNIRLMEEGRQLDAYYNSRLSDDAVPVLLEKLPIMSFEQQCRVKWTLSRRFDDSKKEKDFRSWNYSRWAARNAIAQTAENFDTANCPSYTIGYSHGLE